MTADATMLLRRSPLGATGAADHTVASAEGIVVVERPFRPQVLVRLALTPEASAALQAGVGLAPPSIPNRAVSAGPGRLGAIWLGPDEWLFTMDYPTISARALESRLSEIVRPHGGAVVDVSAHRTVLELRGPRARNVLAAGCSVDLHPRVFEVGHAAQTQLARVDVILSCVAPDTYLVFVRASFATYLADWLGDAMGVIEGGHREGAG